MKSSLAHLVVSLVVCLAALAAYGWWYAFVSAKSAAVTDIQNRIDAKTLVINKMTTTRVALADIVGDESALQSYFVAENDVVSFINGLESRGQAHGATVNVLSVSSEKKPRPTVTFVLTITGTFDAVMRTVGSIEYAPYEISVAALSVGKDGTEGNWNANLKLLVGSAAMSTAKPSP